MRKVNPFFTLLYSLQVSIDRFAIVNPELPVRNANSFLTVQLMLLPNSECFLLDVI